MAQRMKASQIESVLKQLVARQSGKCAICGHHFTKKDGPCLDHDHATGYIRGALHRSCNGVEGKVRYAAMKCHTGIQSYPYLIGLGKYLEHHNTPRINLLHPTHMTEGEKRDERNTKARLARARKKKT